MIVWTVIVLVAVLALAALLFLRRAPASDRAAHPPAHPSARPREAAPPAPQPAAAAPAPVADPRELPPELRDFQWRAADALPQERLLALTRHLRGIPRPPHALHKLLAPEFLASATSQDLSELIRGEPLITAKLLGAVNSPLYGLQKPVASIGQAVTFLGLNAVRGLCLQYMLDASFKGDGPEQQAMFDTIWRTSALACNYCAKLAQQLALPEQGSLVTQVVLYFLGQVAIYTLVPKEVAIQLRSRELLDRLRAEQDMLGLNASELGALLMREWAVPDSIIDDVRDIDHVLDRPAGAVDPVRGARLALCYLCARMAEDAIAERRQSLEQMLASSRPEFFHLGGYLQIGALARLPDITRTHGLPG